MKNKIEHLEEAPNEHDLELLKAVAQAWYGHSTTPNTTTTTSEFDAHRLNFKRRPTKFKLEAINKVSTSRKNSANKNWDFRESLWDSYEIVTTSKRLEEGMVLDDPNLSLKKPKESRNSLRNLLKMVSSRRFNEADIPNTEEQ